MPRNKSRGKIYCASFLCAIIVIIGLLAINTANIDSVSEDVKRYIKITITIYIAYGFSWLIYLWCKSQCLYTLISFCVTIILGFHAFIGWKSRDVFKRDNLIIDYYWFVTTIISGICSVCMLMLTIRHCYRTFNRNANENYVYIG